MLYRKLIQIGSALYRTFLFPFVRLYTEIKTHSIMKQKSYFNQGTVFEGKHYIGKNVSLSNVLVGYGTYISDRGNLKNVKIGKYTSIGTDVSCLLGKHPTDTFVAMHPAFYSSNKALSYTYSNANLFEEHTYLKEDPKYQIKIGNDVWIGSYVKIMEGITIGDGAVIGAGALVTGDVEPYGIYVGVPAKKIKSRFTKEQMDKLEKLKWWERDEVWIREHIAEFSNIELFLQ